MPREMPEPKQDKPQDVIDLSHYAALVVSGPFLPLLRSRCGSHAFEHLWPCVFYIPFYAAFTDAPEIIYWVPVWLVLLVFRRLTHDRNQHSRYRGWPWLGGLFTRREKNARLIEATLVLAGGYALDGPAGKFLMIGAAGLFVTFVVESMVIQSRERINKDNAIEAENMARVQRGGRWW